jgi:hypothetical protein
MQIGSMLVAWMKWAGGTAGPEPGADRPQPAAKPMTVDANTFGRNRLWPVSPSFAEAMHKWHEATNGIRCRNHQYNKEADQCPCNKPLGRHKN